MHTRLGMTAAILLFASAAATAQPPTPPPMKENGNQEMMSPQDDRGPMHRENGPDRRMLKELQLTDQQKTEFRALRADMEKAMVKIQADIKSARIDLRQLVLADKPDRGAIEKKIKEISAFQHEAKMAIVNHLFTANAKLTPEQQKKFREHMATRLMEDRGPMPMDGRPGMKRHRMGR